MRTWVAPAAVVAALAAAIAYRDDGAVSAPRAHGFDFDAPMRVAATPRVGACHAPGWLEANDAALVNSDTVARGRDFSMALPVRLSGGHGEEAGVVCVLSDDDAVDLTRFERLRFDVFAPVAGLQAELAFNHPWRSASSAPRSLHAGWNSISYDISSDGGDFPDGTQEAREFVLRLVGNEVTYRGRAYIAGIRFVPGADPVVRLRAPRADAQVSHRVHIRARVSASTGRRITSVRWAAAGATGTMTQDRRSGDWHGVWDSRRARDGVRRVVVTARDSAGAATTVAAGVLVRNSRVAVRIDSPGFDSELSGVVGVSAAVKGRARLLRLRAGALAVAPRRVGAPSRGGWRTVGFRLDTRRLPDGAHTLRILAGVGSGRVTSGADVLVRNDRSRWPIARARGARFVAGGQTFRFVGANQYDFLTRTDERADHLQAAATGRVIRKGRHIGWREQVDRMMFDAAQQGITVLRTWAFADGPGPSSLQPALGVYREAAFRKLDYVLDSARRHRVRLILTLANYPSDYGGARFYASQLELPYKNDFFRSARAWRFYARYVAHVVRRINTVNGLPYRSDSAIFAWELINEPRMECHEDGRPAWACDASGRVLRRWIARSAAYVKQLDPHHMVAAGAEGHGRIATAGGSLQWSGRYEGNGNDPWNVQDVPGTDFLTIHVYPNEVGYDMTMSQARRLLGAVIGSGIARGKPVVMSEFGIRRTLPVRDRDGTFSAPGTVQHERARRAWHRLMLASCYRYGCAGTNVWMISDRSDPELNINLSSPRADARRDAPIVAQLERWARRLDRIGER